jgi:hypothetical protein
MRRTVASIAVVVLGAAGLASGASGAETQAGSSHGTFVSASFTTSDGCLQTQAHVLAFEGVNAGSLVVDKGAFAFASVGVLRQDECAGGALVEASSGFVSLGPHQLEVDHQLTSARLQATVVVTDELTGASYPVAVDLVWSGTSTPEHASFRDVFFTPGWPFTGALCRNVGSSTQVFGEAEGTIMRGTTNLAAGGSDFADLVAFAHRGQVVRHPETCF